MDWKTPEHYKGREQAFVKHQLLKLYLERLFMIVGRHCSKITYVDCFAGPWQDDSPKLSSSSIGITAEIMRKCRNAIAQQMNRKITFRALFIEKNKQSYTRLTQYSTTYA